MKAIPAILIVHLASTATAQSNLEPFSVTTREIGDAQGELYKRATCGDFLQAYSRASTYNADRSDTIGGADDALVVSAFIGFAAGYAYARELTIREAAQLLVAKCAEDPSTLFAGME